MVPSTMLEKKDSSSRRRPVWPEWVESWEEGGGLRLASKSSLSMPPLRGLRLGLREDMANAHCHRLELGKSIEMRLKSL